MQTSYMGVKRLFQRQLGSWSCYNMTMTTELNEINPLEILNQEVTPSYLITQESFSCQVDLEVQL